MKTDYVAHDARYRLLRDRGADGWDTAEGYREREAELVWALAAIERTGTRLLELGCGAGNAAAWFVERGFREAGIEALPRRRRELYNLQRRSKVLIKSLAEAD